MSDYIKIGAEASYGAGVPEGAEMTGCIITSIKEDVDRSVMTETTTDTSLPRTAEAGGLMINGSIDMNLRPYQCATLLGALMGNVDESDSVCNLSFGDPTSIQLSVGEDIGGVTEQYDYVGVGIGSVELNFQAKEFVTASFDWTAKNYSKSAYDAPTYMSEPIAVFYRAMVKLNSIQNYKIKSLTMNIDRKLNDDTFVLGDFTQQSLSVTDNTEVTGTMTFAESEFDEFNRARCGTPDGSGVPETNALGEASLKIECTNTLGQPLFVIDAPIAIYSKASKNTSGRSEVEKTVDYQVIAGATDFSMRITKYPILP